MNYSSANLVSNNTVLDEDIIRGRTLLEVSNISLSKILGKENP